MHLGPLGQIGLCPLGDGEVNLNLLLAPASQGLLRRLPRTELMRAARCRGGSLGPVLATPSLPQRSSSVIADGVCLVGDAAGFGDPFTGDGMSLALGCAEELARLLTLVDLAKRPTKNAMSAWADGHRRLIGRRRMVGEMLHDLLARRRLAEAAALILARVPLLAHLAVADAAGFRWRPALWMEQPVPAGGRR